jgi:hypothetical protein
MRKETKNLVIFFVATFIWTWAFYIPIALSGNSPYQIRSNAARTGCAASPPGAFA